MLNTNTERLIVRLNQLLAEIESACDLGIDYHDRLREFKHFCDNTPIFAQSIDQLPQANYDFSLSDRDLPHMWPGGKESYAMRWNAIGQIVDGGPHKLDEAWLQTGPLDQSDGLVKVTDMFVVPIHNFLVDQVASGSAVLYTLLRFKRWVEWFQAEKLRDMYQANNKNGELVLDKSLRCFMFESGIDYPFSEPVSPGGKVDVVAGLETDDPLVLEIKVWDSNKNYKENRIRDGLRQAMDYATKYGKDKGHIVVFNLDKTPLAFVNSDAKGEWPPRIEHGGRTYYFIDVHIAERLSPISQHEKGKPVRISEINLADLLNNTLKRQS